MQVERAAGEWVHRLPRLVEAAGEELVLDVGRGEALTGLGEEADRRRAHHQRAAGRPRKYSSPVQPLRSRLWEISVSVLGFWTL